MTITEEQRTLILKLWLSGLTVEEIYPYVYLAGITPNDIEMVIYSNIHN